jgi:hypothetical protein
MTPMPVALLIELRNTFATFFSEEELRDLTLALGIEYENISGSTKSAKSRELATYLWRRGLLPKLAEVGPVFYPDVPWRKILVDYVEPLDEDQPAAHEPDHRVSAADLNRIIRILADYPMFLTPTGRRTVLTLAGLDGLVNVDLNGGARDVVSLLAVQLNEYGRTREGDYALGRLLAFIVADEALPPSQKETLGAIAAQYGLASS